MIAPVARRWNPHFVLHTYQLARQGKTNQEIADELNVSLELFEAWLVVKGTLQEAIEQGRNSTIDNQLEELQLSALQKQYLTAYAKSGTHLGAHRATGIARTTHYAWQQDETYAEAFKLAGQEFADRLKQSGIRQATGYYKKYKFNKDGSPVMIDCTADHPEARQFTVKDLNTGRDRIVYMRHYFEQHFSPGLLIKLLQAVNPEEFTDRTRSQVEIKGDLSVQVTELIERPVVIDSHVVTRQIEGQIDQTEGETRKLGHSQNGNANGSPNNGEG